MYLVDIITAAREVCHTEMVKIMTRVEGIKLKGYFLYRTLGLQSLFSQTASQLLWEASIHTLMREVYLYTHIHLCLWPGTHSCSRVNWSNVK